MPEPELKARKRSDYFYFLSYRTRWSVSFCHPFVHSSLVVGATTTNTHMNNSIYYHLFDSVVNAYIIEHCGIEPATATQIGLVVSSFCQFFTPVSFPEVLDLGLRVNKLGTSSVTYEVGVFQQGKDTPAAVGGYTHVFVGSQSRKSMPMVREVKEGFEKLRAKL